MVLGDKRWTMVAFKSGHLWLRHLQIQMQIQSLQLVKRLHLPVGHGSLAAHSRGVVGQRLRG